MAIAEWEDMAPQEACMAAEDMEAAMVGMEEVWVAMETLTFELVQLN